MNDKKSKPVGLLKGFSNSPAVLTLMIVFGINSGFLADVGPSSKLVDGGPNNARKPLLAPELPRGGFDDEPEMAPPPPEEGYGDSSPPYSQLRITVEEVRMILEHRLSERFGADVKGFVEDFYDAANGGRLNLSEEEMRIILEARENRAKTDSVPQVESEAFPNHVKI